MKRLYNLDYLRGLAAFGIMVYHYLSWVMGAFSADTFLGRLGIYGVSIFYVLSGLTLYHVYYDKMTITTRDLTIFFKKRVLRIFPLLWVVTLTAILLSREMPNFTELFLNLTGLFGFISWDTYFSAGVWSIGNELVFYIFFPFFILFTKKFKPLMILLSLTILGLYLYFAFGELSPDMTLGQQWRNYINPLNQVFLFLGGFLIGYFFQNLKLKNSIIIGLLLLASGLFLFYPAKGDAINVVTGTNRLVFTTCCFLVCLCFYKLTLRLPSLVHKPLTLLGEASYSVYLLHPIIWSLTGILSVFFRKYDLPFPAVARLILSVLLTLTISYFVYQYFEKFFMKFGRKKQVLEKSKN